MNNLADRLRSAEIEVERLDPDTIQGSLNNFVGTISLAILPDLVRLAHREDPRDAAFFDSFQTPFREDDSALLLDGDDELGAALASASLSELFQSRSGESLTHAAGMLIGSAAFLGWTAKVPGLPGEAASHLQSLGEKKRTRGTMHAVTLSHKGLEDALKAIDAAIDSGQLPEMKQPLPAALIALRDAARGLKDSAAKAANALNANQATLYEELDVYWWVSSGHSHTLEEPLSKAPKAAVPLIAGIELAELVKFLPGPPGANAYLATALRPAKPKATGVPLIEAVTALPDSFSIELPDALGANPEFSPLAFALARQRETGDDTWTSAFSSRVGVNPTKTVKPLALATQAYSEALLARVIGELDD